MFPNQKMSHCIFGLKLFPVVSKQYIIYRCPFVEFFPHSRFLLLIHSHNYGCLSPLSFNVPKDSRNVLSKR